MEQKTKTLTSYIRGKHGSFLDMEIAIVTLFAQKKPGMQIVAGVYTSQMFLLTYQMDFQQCFGMAGVKAWLQICEQLVQDPKHVWTIKIHFRFK